MAFLWLMAIPLSWMPEPIGPAALQFAEGAKVTVQLTIAAGLVGIVLGVVAALGKLSKFVPFRMVANFYIWVIRGTPLLVQVFFVYNLPIKFSDFNSALIALAFNVGAYNAEAIRAGLLAVHKGQMEAARSLGLSSFQTFRDVIFPQSFRVALPPLVNNIVSLLKDSSLAYTIGVVELVNVGNRLSAATFQPVPVLITTAAIYLILTTVMTMVTNAIERQLDVVQHSIFWMDQMLTPRFDPKHFQKDASAYRDHIRLPGHSYLEEDAAFHRALDAAFAAALDNDAPAGRAVAAVAESILFREVIIPFDRLLGQEKIPPHAGGFCYRARTVFEKRLAEIRPQASAADSHASLAAACCGEIFRRILRAIEESSFAAGERWKNPFLFWSNRGALAWIPLNYGLRPEQYDTQQEWDAVLAAVTGEQFTDANTVEYLMMEQFHLALKRMIRETRDYQVTVIHDYRGRARDGTADLYGWDLVVDGYLAAFIQAIRELDEGKRDRLPQFFLFLDANYYEINGSRGVVTYLENLYQPASPNLKPKEFSNQVAAAHAILVEAIQDSRVLKGSTERQLREAFKVHVNITNPFDPAFMLDLTRRDHRKVAFRDVSEEDPSQGMALVTGQGIGEHYNGSGWEDRSLILRGSSLVQVKNAARRLILQQGFSERDVPECLRARALPPDYAERCARLREAGWTTSADFLVNETGYGAKEATVLKAAIYNLAPPGSVVLCYDSLWSSDFWAGMFLCAGLRGANVFPVGPTPPNAPSAATTTLSFLRANLRMLFQAQLFFAEDLERAGGHLRVGLYAHDVQTNDFRKRAEAVLRGRANHAFLRELFPLDPSVEKVLVEFRSQFEDVPFVELRFRPRPFLHLKSQLFGTAEAFRILGLPEMAKTLRAHLAIRQRQVNGMTSQGIGPELCHEQVRAFQSHLDSLPASVRSHVIYTFTTGSHNQNPRSLLLDGEILVAVSGYDCVIALIDFMFVLFVAEWPSNEAEFDRLFPAQHLPVYLKPVMRGLKDQS